MLAIATSRTVIPNRTSAVYGTHSVCVGADRAVPTDVIAGFIECANGAVGGATRCATSAHRIDNTAQWIVVQFETIQLRIVLEHIRREAGEGVVVQVDTL